MSPSNNYEIRDAAAADAQGMLAIYAPIVVSTAISFEIEPPSVAEFSSRVESYGKSHGWVVACLDDVIAGYAYGSPHRARAAYRHSVETSVYVHPEHHRQGLGRTLYEALFPLLIERGCRHAFAGITAPNPASETLHERLGFERIGVFRRVGYKFDRWHDVSWWQRTLDNRPPP